MDYYVIRNQRQVDELCARLKEMRLPFKVAAQSIYPKRSVASNAYYWGVVLEEISKYTGHSQLECHNEYKVKFNFRYDIILDPVSKQYVWSMGVKSTTILDGREFWDYVMKVRADAEVDFGISIPMPNEAFIPELDYEFENTNQRYKL